jgi:hypothetical protein
MPARINVKLFILFRQLEGKRERMLRNKGLGGPHVHPNDTHPTPAAQQQQQPLHQTLSRRESFSPTAPISMLSTRISMRLFGFGLRILVNLCTKIENTPGYI